ncbi:PAQR family membrane homeostasis protein TrhA [Geomesophilobacter sediminis]|uniref:Hemolysin III family protein n=1 Tax=Geomesophilobacter sediminis TaxID=2798584 RepID=A0A8J7S9I0_9BACT|nr:hemolysin III family protein [Geomesophilobacter sediminis]MBJ6726820.1 hemolysin III family protein [Geomesophilobacter sediminis]
MEISAPVPTREQSRKEEIANSLSHAIGLVAAVMATPTLITHAVQRGAPGFIMGASLFAASMVLLYLASTLYHAFPVGKTKRTLQVIEHSAIFLLIAGTYTPFTLGVLRGTWGWMILGLVWGLAGVGVGLKVMNRLLHPVISTGLYLMMGWLILIGIPTLVTRMPLEGLFWIGGGGMAYTTGVIFFAAESRIKYGHFIWHLFVMTGTACHYCAVLWYAA